MSPNCVDVELQEIKKETVLIKVCPNCKGIWLDRGELEAIVRELKRERTNETKGRATKDKKENTILDIHSDLIVFW